MLCEEAENDTYAWRTSETAGLYSCKCSVSLFFEFDLYLLRIITVPNYTVYLITHFVSIGQTLRKPEQNNTVYDTYMLI